MDRKSGSRKAVQDNSIIDQVMMLRFRPIAPKPPESDPDSGGSQLGNKGLLLSGIRTKRKYVRVRRAHKNNNTHRSKNLTSKKVPPEEKKIVTLQLLPEKLAEDHGSPEIDKQGNDSENTQWPIIPCPNPSFPTNIKDIDHVNWTHPDSLSLSMDRTDPADCIESCVIVETITAGSSTDAAVGLGQTYMAGLGPGFVSDPSGRVVWVNEAYETMVSRQLQMAMSRGGSLERCPEMVVRLVLKQGLLMPYWSGSFTSRVKIEYSWRCERWSQTVPCDVWRMENGGFAWRLDLDAALSLALDTGTSTLKPRTMA